MHLRLGIQETIYLLFHYASLHSGKKKRRLNTPLAYILAIYSRAVVLFLDVDVSYFRIDSHTDEDQIHNHIPRFLIHCNVILFLPQCFVYFV